MNGVFATAWLILRNDLRLLWRDLRAGRLRVFSSVALFGGLLVVLQGVALFACIAARRPPAINVETFLWFFFGFVMLGAAMNHAVTVLFERADFDLLLSAPIPSRSILLARLTGMVVAAGLSVAFFVAPIVNGAAVGFSRRYLWGYAVWLLLATTMTCIGVWLTLVLVRWLGARRARTWAQVVAAALGATLYIVFQLHNALPPEVRGAMASRASRVFSHPAFTIVARAGRGEALPILTLLALAAAMTTITTRLLARTFVGGIQDAGVVRTRRRHARTYRFAEGLIRATVRKDVRLIIRDPLLLTRVLPSVFYLAPILFPLHHLAHFEIAALLAPFAVIADLTLSTQLTAIAASGEEGWDLIRLSPASTATLRGAKMAAGMLVPAVVALLITIAIALLGRPGLALLTLVISLLSSAGACWIEVASMRPTPRRDLIRPRSRVRRPMTFGRGLATVVFLGCAGASVVLAAKDYWLLAMVGLGAVVIATIACFTLVELKDIEFEGAAAGRRPDERPAV